MRETPRPQDSAGDPKSEPPQPCLGRALAHSTGASGSGTPHGSDGRSPQTPRGARQSGPAGCFGTVPPVPRQPALVVFGPRARLFVALGLLLLFAAVTWQVVVDGPLRRLDERVESTVVGRGPRPLTEFLADLGNLTVALPVLAAAVAYALWQGGRARRSDALCAVLAMAAVPALVVPLKALTDRPGPLTEATGYFPSGHAATALVAYGGAALLLGRVGNVAPRRWAMPAALGLTLATGIGLVLRGYHWPLDVLGSWLLCGALLLVCSVAPSGVSSSGRRRSSGRTRTG
ncbi:phosphatase PAP2 family protein [Streptomyces sp. NPDC048057]|uniref:phosphatase PAP2 family protein n=1 Tax=Streptomyces sp. NPDC048057 TaxID=3155628 RepID=UPI003403B410